MYKLRLDGTKSTESPSLKESTGHKRLALAWVVVFAACSVAATSANAQTFGCSPAMANDIVCENSKTGTPSSTWDLPNGGAGDLTIQGFATDISVNQGQTISFKINTPASAYTIDIYRIGYYGGMGARKIVSISPSATLPQTQPACLTDSTTNLADCGNWAVSASWQVPSNATSGVYLALLTRTDTGGKSHIVFIVRNDASHSGILYQTSDATWQAYNAYAGHSLYGQLNTFDSANRAFKVSYNRPFITRGFSFESATWVFGTEYPMIRWLEANGFDVTYFTDMDTERNGSLILNHKVYMNSGHDEYWSGPQRANVEAARNAGVNLAFFSGNAVYWKTRWENSIDGSNTPYRTLVCYKETWANKPIDPLDPPTWTGTWRDPRFSPPADGGRPENALTGTIFMVDGPSALNGDNPGNLSIQVPAADGKMRFWRNTTIANLASGQTATLPAGTLGYEWDEDLDNGARPAGLLHLSTATYTLTTDLLLDYGSTTGAGSATHHMTIYRAPSGALVFGAGTMQWSWGLDSNHDNPFGFSTPAPDADMQQATVNLFADMGVQPATLQSGLIFASKSTNTTAPVSTITSPTAGSTLQGGNTVTITGTATASGGGFVALVEVSVDGGNSWHSASGLNNWTYAWTPTTSGQVTLKSRATDDSLNVESPSAGVNVTVNNALTLWSSTVTPAIPSFNDPSAVEVGVKFTSDVSGSILGLRFYKGSANTGTHIGNLWTNTGTLLATTTFTGETASGWQQANFSAPVAITANTVYVASYHTNVGGYSVSQGYFATAGFDNPPLHALQDGASGGNAVYLQGAGGFPVNSINSDNFWVDVVFTSNVTTPAAPVISAVQATAVTAASGAITWATDSPSNSQVDYGTTTAYGTSTTLDSTLVTNHVVNLAGLTSNTLYHFRVKSQSSTGLTTSSDFTFTTNNALTLWSNTAAPAVPSWNDASAVEVGVKFTSDLSGYILGLRFYKGSANTGTHVGNLWTSTGTLLATTTFTGETASGWQQANFSAPVAITANTVYVASYHTNVGGYSVSQGYFATAGFDNPPLHALKDGASGGNAVYLQGAGGFPINSINSDNFWVDVSFSTNTLTLLSLTMNPATVTGGNPSTGTVTLNGQAPVGGEQVSLSSSNTAVATVPTSVTVPAGATTATFPVNTSAVATSTTVTISASGSGTQTTSLTVTPTALPTLSSMALSPSSVTGGTPSTGTVTLSGPAPSGGAVVSLSSNNPAVASVPSSASVTVPAGATTATFPVNTSAVATSTTVTISASYGGTQTTSLTVTPTALPTLSSMALTPSSVTGGTPSTGTVTLSGPAPSGGAVVSLSGNNPAVAAVPASGSVTVPAGATTATFPVNTSAVATSTTVTISASYGGTLTASLTVIPPTLSSLTLSLTSVTGGTSSPTGTVTLNGPAPSGGAAVSLSSNNPAVASVPSSASVTVPAGATTATFPVNTSAVATSTTVTMSASYGVTKTASLIVMPPVVSSLTLSLTSVTGGTSSPTGTVTLNGPAPSGGAVISLSSNNPAVAAVPASGSVTVLAGATTATFPVNTSAVATSTTVTISASYGGTKTASLTVIPPVVSSLALNPSSVIGGPLGSSTGTVTLNGPAPSGGAQVTLSSNNSAAAVPASVTVPAGATSATFPVTTSIVVFSTTATISASYNGTTQTANLAVHSAVPLL